MMMACFVKALVAIPTKTLLTKNKYYFTLAKSYSMTAYSNTEKTIVDINKSKEILLSAQAVCFDVDSTVIPEEGIDQLAEFQGAGAAVAEWTAKAMGGQVLFQDALKARLDIINPSLADLNSYLQSNPPRLTPGVKEVVDCLHERGVIVYLVSGGFRQMIEPVAEVLRIPLHRIYANTLLFHEEEEGKESTHPVGSFRGFDENEPTSRDGGKPAVVQGLIDAHGYKSVVMIGDGATDMQARPPADLFIGFGGIANRPVVREGADWFVTDFQEILDVLKS